MSLIVMRRLAPLARALIPACLTLSRSRHDGGRQKFAGERALLIQVLFSGMTCSFQNSWSSRCTAHFSRAGFELNARRMMSGEWLQTAPDNSGPS